MGYTPHYAASLEDTVVGFTCEKIVSTALRQDIAEYRALVWRNLDIAFAA